MASDHFLTPLTNDPKFANAVHERNRAYYPDLIGDHGCHCPQERPMSLNAYQAVAEGFAVYALEHKILYPALGLAEEAGEVAGKIKRWLRGDGDLKKDEVIAELGDVLWYVAVLAGDLGVDLDTVACKNLNKLRERKAKNTIKGAGDDR